MESIYLYMKNPNGETTDDWCRAMIASKDGELNLNKKIANEILGVAKREDTQGIIHQPTFVKTSDGGAIIEIPDVEKAHEKTIKFVDKYEGDEMVVSYHNVCDARNFVKGEY